MLDAPPRAEGTALARILFAVYAALTIYASLYPLEGWRDVVSSPFAFLVAPWPRTGSGFDVLINVLGYAPYGFLCVAALYPRTRGAAAFAIAVSSAALLSILMESAQNYLPTRFASNVDVLSNIGGALLGAAVGVAFTPWLLEHGPLRRLRGMTFLPGMAIDYGLALVALWLFIQLNPTTLLFGAGDLRDLVVGAVKAAFGFDAVVGNYASPYHPNTAYVLLHHVFGEVNGKRGAWGHAIGGMGAITQAMAKEAARLGVEIECNAPVSRISGKKVLLESGKEFEARAIVANVNPKLLYLNLIEQKELPVEFVERMKKYKCGSATFRMNVALSRLPRFSVLPEEGSHHGSGIIMAPSLAYMERAYLDARESGMARRPIVEMVISSMLDDTLAPKGAHVASLFCQHFAPEVDWGARKGEAVARIFDVVESHAPGFKASILGHSALSPADLEREFGLVGGDIFHGALSLDQLWSARPLLGYADYRSPVKGLYLCGSGAHPGGGVTGAPGHNCAREVLRDLGKRFAG